MLAIAIARHDCILDDIKQELLFIHTFAHSLQLYFIAGESIMFSGMSMHTKFVEPFFAMLTLHHWSQAQIELAPR